MPILSNAKHERFAQELAKGKSADEAYETAGYSPHRQNASRLMANDDIKMRVAEILAKVAVKTEFTIERIAEMLIEDREGARSANQFAAAAGAAIALAKLHGLWVEKSERTVKFQDMSDDELDATIAGLEGGTSAEAGSSRGLN